MMGAVNLNIRLSDDVKRVALDIWRVPVLFVAFSLYKILALLFFMDGFIFSGTFQLGDYDIPLLAMFFIACSFVCVFFAIWLRDSHVFSQSWYLFSLAVCMVLGVLLLFFSSNAGMAVEPIRIACLALGVCFMSFGVMGVHIEFGRLLGMMGMMPTLTYGVASAFGVAVGSLAFYAFVPLPARWVVAFFLPVVVTVLLDRSRKAAFPDQSKLYQEHIDEVNIPWRFMATSVVQGVALGVPLGYLQWSGLLGQVSGTLGYLIAGLLVLLFVIGAQRDFNTSIYQIGFPLVSIGLFMMGVVGSALPLANVLQVAGFFYLDLVLWSLGSYLIKNRNQSVIWLSACPSAALMAGRSCGLVVGSIVLQSVSAEHANMFFSALALFVALAALLLINASNMKTGWGFVRSGDPTEAEIDDAACRMLSEEHALTQRETEIMMLLVKGLSRKGISDELVVSVNTVKSHIFNLYRKLSVHSEDELRRLVAQRSKMLLPDGALNYEDHLPSEGEG